MSICSGHTPLQNRVRRRVSPSSFAGGGGSCLSDVGSLVTQRHQKKDDEFIYPCPPIPDKKKEENPCLPPPPAIDTREGRQKFLEQFGQVMKDGGYVTRDLEKFLAFDSKGVKFRASRDGKISIEGLQLNIPDLAAGYKKDFEEQLRKIKEASCAERASIWKWTKISSMISLVLAVFIVIAFLIFIIYQHFFRSTSDTPKK
jgi:hypothetical protein